MVGSGQIGTESDVYSLQQRIKSILKELGVSQREFAQQILREEQEQRDLSEDDLDNDKKIEAMRSELSKQLKRKSTSIDVLENYLRILNHDRKYKPQGVVVNMYVADNNIFDASTIKQLREISDQLDHKMSGNDDGVDV